MRVSVWIQKRPDFFVGPDLGPNGFQTSSAHNTSRYAFPLVFAFHVCLNIRVPMMNIACIYVITGAFISKHAHLLRFFNILCQKISMQFDKKNGNIHVLMMI